MGLVVFINYGLERLFQEAEVTMEPDERGDPLELDHSLCVVLPGGLEKTVTVHGSKPVMDFLVTLCATYHLNPSDYTAEALSADNNTISFQANSPVGLLEAEKLVLKPRGAEEKPKRPYVPEATVRLLINYNKSHKTVVRVSPRLPLELLLPAVCHKCEFQVESTVLLRDAGCEEPLDLAKTLNQLGLREVFARDTAAPGRGTPDTPPGSASAEPPRREKKQKENSGFFSLFRRRKKKQEVKQPPGAAATYSCSTLPADLPKKRRAPPPPPPLAMAPSLSMPNNLSNCHLTQRSGDSTLRNTKRRAPPPPCASPLHELQAHADVTVSVGSSNTLKSLRERDDSGTLPPSSPSSPLPARPLSSSRSSLNHLHQAADSCLPSFRGKDLSDARAALAKVLTSSVSKGTLMRRLRKLPHGSPFMSAAPKSSGNGVFCSEFESVFTSDLPTESEWEDPTERRGLTTFKVVPPKRANPPETAVSPEVPPEGTAPNSDPEAKDIPSCSDGPEGEAAPAIPEALESSSPPRQDPDHHNRPDSPQSQEEKQPDGSYLEEPADGDERLGRTVDQTISYLEEPADGGEGLGHNMDQTNSYLEEPVDGCEGLGRTVDQTNSYLEEPSGDGEGLGHVDQTNSYLEEPVDGCEGLGRTVDQTNSYLEEPSGDGEGLGHVDQTNSYLDEPADGGEGLGHEDQTNSYLEEPVDGGEGLGHTEDQTNLYLEEPSGDGGEGLGRTEDRTDLEHQEEPDRSVDLERCSFHTVEEKAQEEEASFPDPPPPVFFEDSSEEKDGAEPTTEPWSPTWNGRCEAPEAESTSAGPRRSQSASAPSRFAQAVASAVLRARRLSHSKGSRPEASGGAAPPRSTFQYGA